MLKQFQIQWHGSTESGFTATGHPVIAQKNAPKKLGFTAIGKQKNNSSNIVPISMKNREIKPPKN
jgi:hypothetical protein